MYFIAGKRIEPPARCRVAGVQDAQPSTRRGAQSGPGDRAAPGRDGDRAARRRRWPGGAARPAQPATRASWPAPGCSRAAPSAPRTVTGEAALRAAGLRELHEEAGIALGDPGELVPFSRWITPAEVKIRYDTWFFLATMPSGQEARIDGAEVVDARWFSPPAALAASRRDEILLVFPTIKHLQQLSVFHSAGELLTHARARRCGRCSRRWSVRARWRGSSCPASPATRTGGDGARAGSEADSRGHRPHGRHRPLAAARARAHAARSAA